MSGAATLDKGLGEGIWAAIPTPFNADFGLDEGGVRGNVDHYVDRLALEGVFCNGLMGEVWSLTPAERARILEIMVDQARGRLRIAAVTTHFTLQETIAATRHAEAVGCDLAVLINPAHGPKRPQDLRRYFEAVCGEVGIGIVIFNSAASGYTMPADLLAELCTIPNIRGIKTTAPQDENSQLWRLCGDKCTMSDPHEEFFMHNHIQHGQRIMFADPEPYLFQTATRQPIEDYRRLLFAGRMGEFVEAYRALVPMRKVYNKWIMDPLRSGAMPNAALKHWCELLGMAGGPPRAPLVSLDDAQRDKLAADLLKVGMLTKLGTA